MSRAFRRIVVYVSGWSLLGLGIVGLFLPALQGILFILMGLLVLSRESQWARSLLTRLRERFPRVDAKLQEIKQRRRGEEGSRSQQPEETTPTDV